MIFHLALPKTFLGMPTIGFWFFLFYCWSWVESAVIFQVNFCFWKVHVFHIKWYLAMFLVKVLIYLTLILLNATENTEKLTLIISAVAYLSKTNVRDSQDTQQTSLRTVFFRTVSLVENSCHFSSWCLILLFGIAFIRSSFPLLLFSSLG